MQRVPPLRFRPRYLEAMVGASRGGASAITADRVNIVPLVVGEVMTVDQIIYVKGGAVAGNLRAGIYSAPDGDTPDGNPLLVDSGTVAVSPLANRKQAIPINPTVIEPPIVWVGIAFDNIGNQVSWASGYFFQGDEPNCRYYDLGAWGALDDPCPATTDPNLPMNAWLRKVL